MSGNTCCVCHDPLLVPNDDDEGPSALPDDVLYPCGHHYHWQCALDRATTVCAACGADGRDADGKMLVTVSNEGGVTENFDLSEELEEEAFMLANPQIRRAETFLTLVEQGDWDEAESFLRDEPRVDANVTRRNSAQTALHMAAYNNDADAIRGLLEYGARKDARDDSGQTPLECALEVKAAEAASLLA